jgi:hypothetical protein
MNLVWIILCLISFEGKNQARKHASYILGKDSKSFLTKTQKCSSLLFLIFTSISKLSNIYERATRESGAQIKANILAANSKFCESSITHHNVL